ncbi:hypothetical protein ONR75_24220 [Rhodopseudomonas sp. P2A-2r]|uniref:hypothetical protein n=1 Tax=Rhodopseudomonas sp. P2A-2r TaxID=2991972 RepID=UPI0022341286|nr:hypothetical protein [Rhodopseudomonas sp. P2A-2r]UZE47946.1 hypothetical protein ONR75_24220 [Rhodopseudomonas sp. P2A-2r]
MAALRTCRVCGRGEADGVQWLAVPHDSLCDGCAAAAPHVISMTLTRNDHGPAFSRAKCRCGMLDVSVPRTSTAGRNRQTRLIREHWQAVVANSIRAVA